MTGVKWTPKTAFVLPQLPPSIEVDPVFAALLHLVAFLQLSDDETVDPDDAVEATENIAPYLKQLTKNQLAQYKTQCDAVAIFMRKAKQPDHVVEFFEEFLENMGLLDDQAPDK